MIQNKTQIPEHEPDEETAQVSQLLEKVHLPQEPTLIHGVILGTLMGLSGDGIPLVDFPENDTSPKAALSTVELAAEDVGREITLMFQRGDTQKPIITGLLQATGKGTVALEVDGKKVVLSAEKELVLKCGKASITLSKNGKVLIRGTHLLNHSSGINRIKGGSVHIN